MSKREEKKQLLINALVSTGKTEITKTEITEIGKKLKVGHPYWFTNDEKNKISKGRLKRNFRIYYELNVFSKYACKSI